MSGTPSAARLLGFAVPCISAGMQAQFAMLPVFQPAFLPVTVELADGNFLGYPCNRNFQPVDQLSEHGSLPRQPPGHISGHRLHDSWFFLACPVNSRPYMTDCRMPGNPCSATPARFSPTRPCLPGYHAPSPPMSPPLPVNCLDSGMQPDNEPRDILHLPGIAEHRLVENQPYPFTGLKTRRSAHARCRKRSSHSNSGWVSGAELSGTVIRSPADTTWYRIQTQLPGISNRSGFPQQTCCKTALVPTGRLMPFRARLRVLPVWAGAAFRPRYHAQAGCRL